MWTMNTTDIWFKSYVLKKCLHEPDCNQSDNKCEEIPSNMIEHYDENNNDAEL